MDSPEEAYYIQVLEEHLQSTPFLKAFQKARKRGNFFHSFNKSIWSFPSSQDGEMVYYEIQWKEGGYIHFSIFRMDKNYFRILAGCNKEDVIFQLSNVNIVQGG